QGILFRDAKSLERFKDIRQVVFDKTGTLTTGDFTVTGFKSLSESDAAFREIVYSLEKYSNHPLGKAIAREWKTPQMVRWQKIEEQKGLGMKAVTKEGDIYLAGSFKAAAHLTSDDSHNIYLLKNNQLLGWIDVEDAIRPEALGVISYFRKKNIKTILLS